MSNYACDGQSIPFDAFLRQMLNDPTVAEDFVASYVKNNTISQTDGFKGDSMKHETEMGGTLSEVLPQLNTGGNAVFTYYGGKQSGPLHVVFHV
ncbi:hypothetical protein MKX34_20795 [Paenibacillus sp. FSL R5-0636]|uniref:hypothetical protein n=1 Tax=Paenibacillus TaxID=44249 RepID=UPI00096F0BB0|nr:hypothetical protein [Paenibacillus odorifer]OMD02859.1 hypothetical protein BJP49_24980 [Paenibacillus odorifer]OMD10252.1 hypothetical protein BJP47_05915 [Paenibacillus odorifer]OMD20517.1 hypothetical protein BJP48_31270 [Paenibacillus odorifer]